ncbi:hypothetical protein EA772_14060 [Pedobacter sp. G11]|uniref:ester cyclase n=1 Tax=Pedobacter sp. G11 TaxID=2482728 RepID=UPI000F5D565A|nr:ester cyclase [Pedobacter sp. G11]AZI26406.1 hypothetical protein EA772_14060 [Pedobacter sp. G11]
MKTHHLLVAILLYAFLGCKNTNKKLGSELPGALDTSITVGRAKKSTQPDTLAKRMVRAGELMISGENPRELATYFDTEKFRFHSSDGNEYNYSQLMQYFESYRAAFDKRSIKRGIIIKEGNYISCQTTIQGDFVREFASSPIGKLSPNGRTAAYSLINIFRFDDQGRLVEEWVQVDYRNFLKDLQAKSK